MQDAGVRLGDALLEDSSEFGLSDYIWSQMTWEVWYDIGSWFWNVWEHVLTIFRCSCRRVPWEMKYLGYLEDQVLGVWGDSMTIWRRVNNEFIWRLWGMWLGFVAAGICLKGNIFLFNFLSFLLKATVIYPYGLRLLKSGELWKLLEILDVGKAFKA